MLTPATATADAGTGVFASSLAVPDALVRRLEAILVLGGGRTESHDDPPPYVKNRCDDAAGIVRRRRKVEAAEGGASLRCQLPVLCLSAGTAHVPQLVSGATGLPVWESTASAAYLLKNHGDLFLSSSSSNEGDGACGSRLFVETTSYDTIGNAYYARTAHTEWNGWRTLLVVTSEFHMDRSKAIFDWIFSIPPFPENTHPVSDPPTQGQHAAAMGGSPYELHYLSCPDAGLLEEEALEARRVRERASLGSVRKLASQHLTMGQVWEFLHARHDLYAAPQLVAREQPHHQQQQAQPPGQDQEREQPRNQGLPLGRSNYGVAERDAIAKSYGAAASPTDGS